jgi:hypothetical protein
MVKVLWWWRWSWKCGKWRRWTGNIRKPKGREKKDRKYVKAKKEIVK